MSNKNETLASLFGSMLHKIKTGNFTEKELDADKRKFQAELKAVGNGSKSKGRAYLPDTVEGIQKTAQKTSANSMETKVEMQRLLRSKKDPKTETTFAKTSKSTKTKGSLLEQLLRKRKAKGDSTAEKVRKQREAKNPKPEKKEVKDPKKVKSQPFRLG